MDTVREISESKLNYLAFTFTRDFLSISARKRRHTIGLYGCESEILEDFRYKMEKCLRDHGSDVPVVLGREGYQIDLGECLRQNLHQ